MTVQPLEPLEPAALPDCSHCPIHVAARCTLPHPPSEDAMCDIAAIREKPKTRFAGLSRYSILLIAPIGLIVAIDIYVWMGLISPQLQTGLLALSVIALLIWILVRDRNLSRHNVEARRIDFARIDALAQAERDARIAQRASDVSAAAKATLVANMSHEIRTPMNGVIGFAQLLLSTQLTGEQRKYAELIVESGESMVVLLNDILDIAKIEAGKMEVSPVPTNIRDLLASSSSMMKAAARQKGLELTVSIHGEIPRELMLDGLRVKQVLSNLIGNAIKFTDAGAINVVLKPVDMNGAELIEMSVTDTGIGIAPEWQSMIFEQFVQADASSQRAHGGSGLGLPISRKLAELMGGTLTLDSHKGQGTKVSLRVPLVIPPRNFGKEPQSKRAVERFALRKGRVLIAEDSDVNQLLMFEILASLGYSAVVAGNGQEAVAMVEQAHADGEPIELVLMDVQMPQLDGLQATRKLRSAGFDSASLPIIALTANAFQQDIEACFAVGMQEHLAKPVTQQDLIDALDRWLVHAL